MSYIPLKMQKIQAQCVKSTRPSISITTKPVQIPRNTTINVFVKKGKFCSENSEYEGSPRLSWCCKLP